MASITIRNLDEDLEALLEMEATIHGRSMEDEARAILRSALTQGIRTPGELGSAIHNLFKPLGGVDLPEVRREPAREPPSFE